ncbi:MAG: hypothetical protein ABL962_21825, partial [Fimbriimonadaceae bacterium]
ASGGKCGAGAMSAAVGAIASPFVNTGSHEGNIAAHAVVGGLASVAGGGKFAEGAATAAFGYMFNNDAGEWARGEACQADIICVTQRAAADARKEAYRSGRTESQDWIMDVLFGGGYAGVRIAAAAASSRGAVAGSGEFFFTESAAKHFAERPYMSSPSVTNMIIQSGNRIPDPQGVPGLFMYYAQGTFNSSAGRYELIFNPNTRTVYHYVFKSGVK